MPVNFRALSLLLRRIGLQKNRTASKKAHACCILHLKHLPTRDALFLSNSLITTYSRCGQVDDALRVFCGIREPDVGSWTAIIAGFARTFPKKALQLFAEMQLHGCEANRFTLLSVLPACSRLFDIRSAEMIHRHVIEKGLQEDEFIGTALVDAYAKCGKMDSARKVFDKMSVREKTSWTALLAGCVQNGFPADALLLLRRANEFEMDSQALVSAIPACAELGEIQKEREIHGMAIRRGFDRSVFVSNAFLSMYCLCGRLEDAFAVFQRMPWRDLCSWNAIIAGYAKNCPERSLELFSEMLLQGLKPNEFIYASILSACARQSESDLGRMIHQAVLKEGFDCDEFVGTALLDMYSKCGEMEDARKVFGKLRHRDMAARTAMVAGFAQNGMAGEAVMLFQEKAFEGLKVGSQILGSLLPACAQLGAFEQGQEIHGTAIRLGLESSVFLSSALLDMYCKCGRIGTAKNVFERMLTKSLASWNAMIVGYATQGLSTKALDTFNAMLKSGIKPDAVTFVGALSACSHAGLVGKGLALFEEMNRNHQIEPEMDHYSCIVDLLGRRGKLLEAKDFISRMPVDPALSVWQCLLNACKLYRNVELGELSAKRVLELDPKNTAPYVLLAQIYADASKWKEIEQLQGVLKTRYLSANPGCSWIHVNKRLYSFIIGDRSHPQSREIYSTLESLIGQMKEMGYSPFLRFVMHDTDLEQKEILHRYHSEKLALAFGLIHASPKSVLHISSNHRICNDCHSLMKFVSKLHSRVIIIRDAYRFHHFKDGLCSCNEFW